MAPTDSSFPLCRMVSYYVPPKTWAAAGRPVLLPALKLLPGRYLTESNGRYCRGGPVIAQVRTGIGGPNDQEQDTYSSCDRDCDAALGLTPVRAIEFLEAAHRDERLGRPVERHGHSQGLRLRHQEAHGVLRAHADDRSERYRRRAAGGISRVGARRHVPLHGRARQWHERARLVLRDHESPADPPGPGGAGRTAGRGRADRSAGTPATPAQSAHRAPKVRRGRRARPGLRDPRGRRAPPAPPVRRARRDRSGRSVRRVRRALPASAAKSGSSATPARCR